jgi:hypothetical protein
MNEQRMQRRIAQSTQPRVNDEAIRMEEDFWAKLKKEAGAETEMASQLADRLEEVKRQAAPRHQSTRLVSRSAQ